MNPNTFPEIRFTTASMTPREIYQDIKDMSSIWVLNDPDYEPLSSSEIREIVARLMRKKFYVVSGEING